MGVGGQKWGCNTSRAGENHWRTGKKTYKSMKQQENEQNYTKKPMPVMGIKPNGKSQLK
jgi:hypothetical protein